MNWPPDLGGLFFVNRPSLGGGLPMTKNMVLNPFYGAMDEPDPMIIDASIYNFSMKLAETSGGQRFIEMVWGRGHVLCCQGAATAQDKAA